MSLGNGKDGFFFVRHKQASEHSVHSTHKSIVVLEGIEIRRRRGQHIEVYYRGNAEDKQHSSRYEGVYEKFPTETMM